MDTMKKCPTCSTLFSGELCPRCMAGFAQEPSSPTQTGEEPPPLQLGMMFHGLEIVEILGRGGMGIVYKGRQPALDRFVALKILPRKLALDPDFQGRFAREAKALASLSHPNIIAVHDFGALNGLFFFVMEYVDGVNLRQVIREKKLTPEQAFKIVPQLCDALEYAHEEGVVHRDIKPENILLDRKGRVKIADFGLAKLVGTDTQAAQLTQTNVVMGTPHYMAPEQFENPRGVDHRADIYSMGVVFYEMLTGELPLGRFEVPSKRVQVDVRLDEVVLKTLERQPDRRYQRASHVKDAITAANAGGPSAPSWAPTVMTKPPERRKSPAVVLGCAALLLAVIATIAILALTLPKRPPQPVPQPEKPAEDLRAKLPDAAAVDPAVWKQLLSTEPMKQVENETLTYILLTQRPRQDLEVLDKDRLYGAIEKNGRATVLQPGYITFVGEGIVKFEAPGIFRGLVEYTARDGEIVEFRLPLGKERIVREGARWRAIWPDAKIFERTFFSMNETPANHRWLELKELGRNPFLAKADAEIDKFVQYLDGVFSNLSRSEVRQAYHAGWYGVGMAAVETPAAERLERDFLADKALCNRWAYRRGEVLIVAFAAQKSYRAAFADLVYRIQKKLDLPVEPAPFPIENIMYAKRDMPHDFVLAEKFGSIPLPFWGKSDDDKMQLLGGMKDFVDVKPADLASIFCAAFQRKGAAAPAFYMIAMDFKERRRADEIAAAAAKVRGWNQARRIEILQAAGVVNFLFLHSQDYRGFERFARNFREWMGHPPVSFETLIPNPEELPDGFTIDQQVEDPKAILEHLGYKDARQDDIVRSIRITLQPEGSIVLLEIRNSDVRNKMSYALKDTHGMWDDDYWVCAVEGPPALRELMRAKFDEDP